MDSAEKNYVSRLREEVRGFPLEPGVYIMRDEDGTILYIGKAKQLRNRVGSYFAKSAPLKVAFILKALRSISYIVTSNEYEALLLENNLIKKHQPKYNVNLKDGKTYPVIRITNEKYPRMFKTRQVVEDGSDYFGPYPNVDSLNTYLEILWKTLPLRRCRRIKSRSSPCLYYHLGRCAAVCAGKMSNEAYHERVQEIRKFLRGSTKQFEVLLETKMKQAAEKLQFEQAREMRDALYAIQAVMTEQRVQDFNVTKRDYLAYVEENNIGVCVILRMQDGQLHGAQYYTIQNTVDDLEDVVSRCIMQHYEEKEDLPENVFTFKLLSNAEIVQQWFLKQCNATVDITMPKNTQDARLVHMAIDNAWRERRKIRTIIGTRESLQFLQDVLSIPSFPNRIEGFDIAHIGGRHTIGAMVVVVDGSIDAKQHRLFRIRTVESGDINDVASIKEVVLRRYMRLKNENGQMPDLVVIDGGKAQLNKAIEALRILDLDIPIVAIAKRNEILFTQSHAAGLQLPGGDPALRIVQMVRDEAHRFATNARSRAQSKEMRANTLMAIPGIGAKRAEKILKEFKHLSAVLEVSYDVLAKTLGISPSLAKELQQLLATHLNK